MRDLSGKRKILHNRRILRHHRLTKARQGHKNLLNWNLMFFRSWKRKRIFWTRAVSRFIESPKGHIWVDHPDTWGESALYLKRALKHLHVNNKAKRNR